MNYSTSVSRALIVFVALMSTACSTFDITTPSNMVAVEKTGREYVAMTSDGIILRALVHKQGDETNKEVGRASLEFWVDSVSERMRTRGGYALLAQSRVTSDNGVEGAHLQFGRDQGGETYLYSLTIFVSKKNVHVIDAGGAKASFEAVKPSIEAAIKSYEVKR